MAGMPPRGHVGVVVCGTRLAARWRDAFRAAGIPAEVEETDADEAAGGACKVTVPRARLVEANAIVTAVTRGERHLPGARAGWAGVVAIAVIVALAGGLALGVAR